MAKTTKAKSKKSKKSKPVKAQKSSKNTKKTQETKKKKEGKKKSKISTNKKENKQKKESKKMSKKSEENKKIAQKLSEKKTPSKSKEVSLKKNLAPALNTPTIIALVVIVLVGLAYIFRGSYLAAIVNGQPISRLAIMREAEKFQGTQILEQKVLEELVIQKAREEGVQISDEVVNAKLDEIKEDVAAQGQDFDMLLEMQGMTEDELRRQIRLQEMVEQLVGAEVEISDAEIEQYIENNRDFLPEEAAEEELEDIARQQLEQQALSGKYQDWIDNLKRNARVQYFVDYAPEQPEMPMIEAEPEPQIEIEADPEMEVDVDIEE